MIDIVWQVFQPENPWSAILKKPITYLAPDWAEAPDNTAGLVRDMTAALFDDDMWGAWFGLDETEGAVMVEIQKPEALRGCWFVSLERVTHATATAIADPRPVPI